MADTTHAPQAGQGRTGHTPVRNPAAAQPAVQTGQLHGHSPAPSNPGHGHSAAPSSQVPGYSPAMDALEHESTYNNFVHFTTVGTLFVIGCVLGLAVGGIKHAWLWAIFGIVVVHIAAAVGLFAPGLKWKPGAAAIGLMLLMLIFF